MKNAALRTWGECLDCGYAGMLEYFHIQGESYDDQEALGLMMLLHCPACGSREHTLLTMEYYRHLCDGRAVDE